MIKKLLVTAVAMFSIAVFSIDASAQQNPGISKSVTFTPQKNTQDSLPLASTELSPRQQEYKNRLDSIQSTVPLVYNAYVQKYIDIYASRSKQIAKALGLSKYYFPIFDNGFKQYNIPEEIKFLSIIESSLNPLAISRTGATGPWQFTLNTAKGYGLKMDEYVDERRDPVAASYAAANYLRNAYTTLGDWLLAIASYNCGEGAVARAIKKAGNVYDFWAIREYLPVETQNYVPAFIATTYIMNYYAQHNIVPDTAFSPKTALFQIDKFISLAGVAKAANVDVKLLAVLNPLYKTDIINGTAEMPKSLVLPELDAAYYPAVYEAINNPMQLTDSAFTAIVSQPQTPVDASIKKPSDKRTLTYKVKQGDTLTGIAEKFEGAKVSEIKANNRLRNSSLQAGMILKIN